MTDIPVDGRGKATWEDYNSFWRELDVEWLQDRSILRYEDDTDRDADLTSPQVGQVVYQEDEDILYLRSTTGSWKRYPGLPPNLLSDSSTPGQVTLGYFNGTDPGTLVPSATLSSAGMSIPSDLVVKTDVLQVNASGVSVKTGAATALLSTDADDLVSSVDIKATGFTTSGAVAAGSVSTDSLAAGSATVTGALDASGQDVTASRFISGDTEVGPNGLTDGTAVFQYGTTANGSGAHINNGGAASLTVETGDVEVIGDLNLREGILRVYGDDSTGDAPGWYYNGTYKARIAPTVYGGSPVASEYPHGTIWVT